MLRASLFPLLSLLRPLFMAMLLMVHIFQSNMFRIRPHNEVMTPSCAAPTQGSLPYIWLVHIWLKLTADQMLHPSEPRPTASSTRGWGYIHTLSHIPTLRFGALQCRGHLVLQRALVRLFLLIILPAPCWGRQAVGTHLQRYANIRFPASSPDRPVERYLKPGSESGAYMTLPPTPPGAGYS